MFAATARLRGTNKPVFSIRKHQLRIRLQRRQATAIRYLKTLPAEGHVRIQGVHLRQCGKSGEMLGKIDKALLKLSAEQIFNLLRS